LRRLAGPLPAFEADEASGHLPEERGEARPEPAEETRFANRLGSNQRH
jgi:hypothetical protein